MSAKTIVTQLFSIALFARVLTGLQWDFATQLGFYGAYHQDPVNQAIHFVFVPVIWWTFNIWFCYVPILGMPFKLAGHRITYGTVQLIIYTSYYLQLDPSPVGKVFSAILVLLYLAAYALVSREVEIRKGGSQAKPIPFTGTPAWKWAVALHILAWYLQIHPGHAVYEKVKPALFDSIAQSFGAAPLFAFYEGLWAAGYAKDLQARVLQMVFQHRLAMCTEGGEAAYHFCKDVLAQAASTAAKAATAGAV